MISVARPLAKPQQLPHGCLLCGMSPDAEKPAVSVYRKFICSEPQSQNSKTQREEDFQLGNVTKLWILIDFAAWNSTMPQWTFDIPMISLELKMINAMTLGFVSLASALYNDVPKAGV